MSKIISVSLAVLLSCLSPAAFAAPAMYDQQVSTIKVVRSQPVFIIKLNSNPTTGYSWSLREYDKSFITSVKHDYHAPTAGLVGAPGYELWTFRVKPAAFSVPVRTNITFVYVRSWEKKPAETEAQFEVTTQP